MFWNAFAEKRRSIVVGYIMLLLGFHYAYYRQRRQQLWYLFTLGGFGVWFLIDALRIPTLNNEANHQAAMRVLNAITLTEFMIR